MAALALRADGIARRYPGHNGAVEVFARLSLEVAPGEKVAVTGESGVGKSTLLHLLGGLDRPDEGAIRLGGSPYPAEPEARALRRRGSLGFVFQFHHLLAEFTARENVLMPALIAGEADAGGRADELLARLGLAARAGHLPSELSGGEQQRCAIARALLMRPGLVLADEPTGNLDPRIGEEVFSQLLELASERTFTLVVATHNAALAARCDRVLHLARAGLQAQNPSRA